MALLKFKEHVVIFSLEKKIILIVVYILQRLLRKKCLSRGHDNMFYFNIYKIIEKIHFSKFLTDCVPLRRFLY